MSSLLRLPRSRSPSTVAAYYRFYSVARAIAREEPHANQKRGDTNGSLELRKEVLLRSGKDLYPRIHTSAESMRIPELLARSKKLPKGTTAHDGAVTLYGTFSVETFSIVGLRRQEGSSHYVSWPEVLHLLISAMMALSSRSFVI